MRILCLHGRGSNNDIFKMQTAGFRSLLEDFEFDFVQGQMPHVEGISKRLPCVINLVQNSLTSEGNWSLHTTDFATSKLWGYFNMLDAHDILDTERELLQLALEDGPYDGILGYSQGATLAAQTVIRYTIENPAATVQEMPFRFAIFFNAATPSRVFEMTEKATPIFVDHEPQAIQFYKTMKANPLLHTTKLFPAQLPNGRKILTDGKLGMMKCDAAIDGALIKIPTLHVRCPTDREEYGQELYRLCEPAVAQEYFHSHKHDFPRGYDEMRQIARFIRSTAELSI